MLNSHAKKVWHDQPHKEHGHAVETFQIIVLDPYWEGDYKFTLLWTLVSYHCVCASLHDSKK